jgi:hypothetical protein
LVIKEKLGFLEQFASRETIAAVDIGLSHHGA